MGKYYTTVNFMAGTTKKVVKLNEELRTYVDMLITSDESKAIVQRNITELVRHINLTTGGKGTDIKVRTFNAIGGGEFIQMDCAANQTASVWFHILKSEI